MQRDLYKKLVNWKTSNRRKPLILKGARQVGKTHLLKAFGASEFKHVIYINFETDPELKKIFLSSLASKNIINKLSIYTEQEIKPGVTLIFFDEIQECPEALNSLKYFQEDANEFHVVAAGSLLGVKLANTKGFPVGKVDFLELHPLSFFEFLTAIDKAMLRDYVEKITEVEPIDEPFHDELLSWLKIYLYIGGMPEAVAEYVDTKDLLAIRNIQEAILKAYDLDFSKHAPKDILMKISQVWESIPRQLAKENKKFVFSVVKESARGREYTDAIQWLCEAGLILKSYNITVPKLPLLGYGDTNAFKVFLLDVGLLGAMCKVPVKILAKDDEILREFYGAFTENYVAQELIAKQIPLYYWTSEGVAEVDFIVEHELKIYPLEVKAGISRKKKSLLVYADRFSPRLLLRASTMNLKHDGKVCNFPLYLIGNFATYL